MVKVGEDNYWTQSMLVQQLQRIGIKQGDVVMAHVAMRSVGNCLNGADALIHAILTVLGIEGVLLCYTNWEQNYEDSLDVNGYVPSELKSEIMPYDRSFSRASKDHGVFAECVRTTKGAIRSQNPGASVVAIGNNAEHLANIPNKRIRKMEVPLLKNNQV
ncbi:MULTISPECIES: AAC(3) family N-acetyltransferase, partial [Xenorhabdus]|uniref:AAC(3) family N-acetyltransferase n=1 Tax=Xenorhabdus TaxID=626 RepID=UPI000649F490